MSQVGASLHNRRLLDNLNRRLLVFCEQEIANQIQRQCRHGLIGAPLVSMHAAPSHRRIVVQYATLGRREQDYTAVIEFNFTEFLTCTNTAYCETIVAE